MPVSEQLEGDRASTAGLEDGFTWNHSSVICWDDDMWDSVVTKAAYWWIIWFPRSYTVRLCVEIFILMNLILVCSGFF